MFIIDKWGHSDVVGCDVTSEAEWNFRTAPLRKLKMVHSSAREHDFRRSVGTVREFFSIS